MSYGSVYGGKSTVADLLVNGSDMLYQLLDSSAETQGLVDVMKSILNDWANGKATITDFDFKLFSTDKTVTNN